MKKIILTICFLCISSVTIAQTAKTSLTAKKIKNVLYLKLDSITLRYGVTPENKNVNQKLSKTTTFASIDKSVTIYLKVRNPIVDEIVINTKVIENLNSKEFKETLLSYITNFKGIIFTDNQINLSKSLGFKPVNLDSIKLYSIKSKLDSIQLKIDSLPKFNNVVLEIVKLINKTDDSNYSVNKGTIKSKIETLEEKVKSQLTKENLKALIIKNQFEWYKATKDYEKKIELITTLVNYLKQLQKWFKSSDKNDGFYKLKTVDDLKRDSIQVLTIKIINKVLIYNKDKTQLTLKKEGDEINNTLNFEKFRRFIPEVRAAVVFTDLLFPKFGTEINENDEQVLVAAGDEKFNKINVGIMINFNYNLGDDELVPFFQLGIGPSKKFPILFSGLGIRINDNFMLSLGGAWTWINELSSLKIGDVVSGTAAIESDQAFKFSTSPKLYLSFQVKL